LNKTEDLCAKKANSRLPSSPPPSRIEELPDEPLVDLRERRLNKAWWAHKVGQSSSVFRR
jgi:hypothetical protein